jgi:TetR/AcrR family transcriptional regulator, transcriptional repressor for nem operon
MNARQSLIKSAQELLWERGYVGMSPKAIQERAGAGQGSMYHHFKGKSELAAEAILQSAIAFRDGADKWLTAPGTPLERIRSYMLRSRQVLKGCQIGKLTQDPEIAADADLRRPIDETFEWLQNRLSSVLAEGQKIGEISTDLDATEVAATLISVIQGGYVLASAAASPKPFHRAIRGVLSLLERSLTGET